MLIKERWVRPRRKLAAGNNEIVSTVRKMVPRKSKRAV
jgi:hypothetical protein